MKRVIIIESILFVFFILFGFMFIWDTVYYFIFLGDTYLKEDAILNLYYAIFYFVMFVADGVAMAIIALNPLPGIKPIVEKYKVFKEKRTEQRAIKAENDKKEKIAELERELSELKKDG